MMDNQRSRESSLGRSRAPRASEGEPAPHYLDLVKILWRRRLLVALTLLGAWVLAAVLYFVVPPVYESTAKLLVIKKSHHSVTSVGQGDSEFETNLSVHQSLINSPAIIQGAIDEEQLLALPSLQHEELPVELITDSLFVEREQPEGQQDNNSAILSLAYRSTSADDCPQVLEALIDSYQGFLNRIHRFDNEATREVYLRWKQEVQKDLDEKTNQYALLKAGAARLGVTERNSLEVPHSRLAEVERERVVQSVRRAELAKKLEVLTDGRKRGLSAQALAELASRWMPAPTSRTFLQDQLHALSEQEQLLLSKFGQEHPEVAAIRKRIQKLQQQMVSANTVPTNRTDPLALEESLRQELAVTTEVETALTNMVGEARGELSKSVQYFEKAELLRSEISLNRELYREIVRQLQAIDLVKDANVYNAEIIAQPKLGEKVIPSAPVLGIILTALGLVVGCGLAFLAESVDTSLRNPQQIHQQIGVAVMGQIPRFRARKGESTGESPIKNSLDTRVRVVHQADSAAAEAYHSLRTSLYFGAQDAQILAVTSPDPGDGKSTLVANLAASMAQAGKSVLLVDADFRDPSLHAIFGLQNERGLQSILDSDADPQSVIQSTAVPRLSVLPAGPSARNPAELFLRSKFNELLESCRRDFDYVLLDCTSVLGKTDACVIAPQVDAVLLTVLAASDLARVARAAETLESLHANLLGVVMNGVPDRLVREFGVFPVEPIESGHNAAPQSDRPATVRASS